MKKTNLENVFLKGDLNFLPTTFLDHKDLRILSGVRGILRYWSDEDLYPSLLLSLLRLPKEFKKIRKIAHLRRVVCAEFFYKKKTIKEKEPSFHRKTSANKEPISHFVNQSESWKNDQKAETKNENNDFLNPDDNQTAEIKENRSSPIKVNINSIEKEKVRSFDEIFKYKQQLENQIEKLAIVKEIKLAFEYTNDINDFLSVVTTLIHSKMPGDKVEIFLNHTARQEFLTNSSFLTLRCSIENDEVIHYSMEDGVSQKLMLNIGEEGRALSHLHGIILNEKNHSTLNVPMVEKMSIIGAIRLKSFEAGLYGYEEKFILEKLANHIATHLSHSNSYQKVT